MPDPRTSCRNRSDGVGSPNIRPESWLNFPGRTAESRADHGLPMRVAHSHLKDLDYSIVQQCMHCGLCLPTCPTYDATKLERNSPRGRIALMRAIADGRLEASKAFAEEMYFCLGCLACMTACPAGVNYAELFEHARAEAESSGALSSPKRNFIRSLPLKCWFATDAKSSRRPSNSAAARFMRTMANGNWRSNWPANKSINSRPTSLMRS